MIFVTLSNGPYQDYWLSDPVDGTRLLHWCGQNSGAEDHHVVSGTQVWMRNRKADMFFDHVGDIQSIVATGDTTPQATYRILVNLNDTPTRIHRSLDDRFTHWAVLRYIGIQHTGSIYFPRGIYTDSS